MKDNNTGVGNTGNWNTGNKNTGNWNTGNKNTGDWNTGNKNTGDWNTGDWNTGDKNTGDWNTGNKNTGDWNTGNWNTGYLNTDSPTIRFFNKDSGLGFDELSGLFPNYFYFEITEWINEEDMTDKEKEENPSYGVCEGYLKVYNYKEAWRLSWDKAGKEDKEKTLKLPNWNNELFLEISGIDVEKELNTPEVKEFSMDEVAKALGVDVKSLKIKK